MVRSLPLAPILLAAMLLIRRPATFVYLGDFRISSQTPQSADLILVLAAEFFDAAR